MGWTKSFGWFEHEVRDAFAFLSAYSMEPRPIEQVGTELCCAFVGRTAAVEVMYGPGVAWVATEVVLLEDGRVPERRAISLSVHQLLEATSDDRELPRLSEVRGIGLAELRLLIRAHADVIRDHPTILDGDPAIIERVRADLQDIPGDPDFDWWIEPRGR